MENRNTQGSIVADGFKCKPLNSDPNKPLIGYRFHLFLCDGGRCNSVTLADELRDLTKELNLSRGENRIKITRSFCFGACRFKSVALIYGLDEPIWIKNIENINWRELFLNLVESNEIKLQDGIIEVI